LSPGVHVFFDLWEPIRRSVPGWEPSIVQPGCMLQVASASQIQPDASNSTLTSNAAKTQQSFPAASHPKWGLASPVTQGGAHVRPPSVLAQSPRHERHRRCQLLVARRSMRITTAPGAFSTVATAAVGSFCRRRPCALAQVAAWQHAWQALSWHGQEDLRCGHQRREVTSIRRLAARGGGDDHFSLGQGDEGEAAHGARPASPMESRWLSGFSWCSLPRLATASGADNGYFLTASTRLSD
jgi:hypothetical protein